MQLLPLDALLWWGLFYRLYGIIYMIAWYDQYLQAVPFAGERGIRPIRFRIARLRQDFSFWKRCLYFPSLFWISQSDFFIRLVAVAGGLSGVAMFYGGNIGWWGAVIGWICHISYLIVIPTMSFFPFQVQSIEMGFACIFLPTCNTLLSALLPNSTVTIKEAFSMSSLPLSCVAFMLQFLLFRLMFGFGKFKFLMPGRKDMCFLKSHLVNQLSPTPIAYFMYHTLPFFAFQLALAGMFVVEVINPFLLFSSNPTLIIVANISFIMLQLGITVTGNYSYFNVITTCLCLASLADSSRPTFYNVLGSMISNPVQGVITSVLMFGGLLYLPWWTWTSCTWIHWPFFSILKNNPLLEFYRWLYQLKLVNAYGVFPTFSAPPCKVVTIFEGSYDGKTWKKYKYRELVTGEYQIGGFTSPAPHMYERVIDYCGRSQYSQDFHSAFMTDGPYEHSMLDLVTATMKRLMEKNNPITEIFRKCPFPPSQPPTHMRAAQYLLSPTSLQEYWKTGKAWRRDFITLQQAPISVHTESEIDPLEIIPSPEMFHADNLWWKMKTTSMGKVITMDGYKSVMDMEETNRFWDEFLVELNRIPSYANAVKSKNLTMEVLTEVKDKLHTKFGKKEMIRFCMTLGRLTGALYKHLEPHFYQKATPFLPVTSNFHLDLLMQHIVVRGKEHYLNVIKDHSLALEDMHKLSTIESTFFVIGIFKFNQLVCRAHGATMMFKYRFRDVEADELKMKILPGFTQLFLRMREADKGTLGEVHLPDFTPPTLWGDWKTDWSTMTYPTEEDHDFYKTFKTNNDNASSKKHV